LKGAWCDDKGKEKEEGKLRKAFKKKEATTEVKNCKEGGEVNPKRREAKSRAMKRKSER